MYLLFLPTICFTHIFRKLHSLVIPPPSSSHYLSSPYIYIIITLFLLSIYLSLSLKPFSLSINTCKSHMGPSYAPPPMGPNPSAISEFSEYITPKRIPSNFKRRKPTYIEERKDASLVEMLHDNTSHHSDFGSFRDDDSTMNSSVCSHTEHTVSLFFWLID